MRYYTGIGSRETPGDILDLMKEIAVAFYREGYTLRSGGASGADQAFEHGLANADKDRDKIQAHAEIYLPWESFEFEKRSWIKPKRIKPQKEAYELAAKYHPRWKFLTPGAMTFHARNMHQIFGNDVTEPVLSDFVICWTKDAKSGGGTGQAIRAGKDHSIPIYDLADENSIVEIWNILDGSYIL